MKTFILCVLAMFLGVGSIAQIKKDSITVADFHVKKTPHDPFVVKKEHHRSAAQSVAAPRQLGEFQLLKTRLDNGQISEEQFDAGIMQLVTNNMHVYGPNRLSFRSVVADPLGGVIITLSNDF